MSAIPLSRSPAPEARIAAAFIAACGDELDALKPGNVHRHADGHGMRVDDFVVSAEAAAPALTRRGRRVGQRILDAVAATRDAVGCNTNLGIVLLCAPLARAAEGVHSSGRPGTVVERFAPVVAEVLAELDVADCENAFRAIALAAPAGLGRYDDGDVHAPARIDLRRAMQLAAERDRIAYQYASGYADIFEFALPSFERLLSDCDRREHAVSRLYLNLLARWPDSHLLRKFGDSVAQSVTQEARRIDAEIMTKSWSSQLERELAAWDSRLKIRGLNPGTSADLTVATLFLHRLGEA
jgi:triphosphoribosyl-dephospho-CoA synthase